jgi:hypothetical protein
LKEILELNLKICKNIDGLLSHLLLSLSQKLN